MNEIKFGSRSLTIIIPLPYWVSLYFYVRSLISAVLDLCYSKESQMAWRVCNGISL